MQLERSKTTHHYKSGLRFSRTNANNES